MRTNPMANQNKVIVLKINKTVLKIKRYAQRLTQGYMGDGGSCKNLSFRTEKTFQTLEWLREH